MLQTPEFAHQRQVAEAEIGPVTYSSGRAVEDRQRMLRRPDGPSYEVVLDEVALRPLSAPPAVMAAQVEHLVTCAREPKITQIPILTSRQDVDAARVCWRLGGRWR